MSWIDAAFAQIKALTPERGFNVVAVDRQEPPGEGLYLVSHWDNADDAERARRDHCAETGDPAYVYAAPDAPQQGHRQDDFDESQHPRDEAGRFAEAGGAKAAPNTAERKAAAIEKRKNARAANVAKRKAEIGTTAFNKEKKEKDAAAGRKRAEAFAKKRAEKEKAEREAREARYAQREAERAAKEKVAAGFGNDYNAQREADKAREAFKQPGRDYKRGLWGKEYEAASGMDPYAMKVRGGKILEEENARAAKEGQEPSAARTLPGQQNFPDHELTAGAKEIRDREERAVRNNAKLGENAERESAVRERVREQVAKEKEAEVARMEAAIKAEAVRKEKAEKFAAAQKAANEAQVAAGVALAREQVANEAWAKAGQQSHSLASVAAGDLHREMREARAERRAAEAARDKANAERDALRPSGLARDSSPGSRAELEFRSIAERKPNGDGGMMEGKEKFKLDDGTRANWKPADGERFARGNIDPGTYYLREAAVSRVAPLLGAQDLVPACVVKEFPNTSGSQVQKGSLHAWADGDVLADARSTTFDRDGAERMRVADYIMGGSDRHKGNVVVTTTSDGRKMPAMIDNGLSLPKGEPERFIYPYDNVPHDHGLLPSTHDQIQSINTAHLARELHAAGIEREAIEHVALRAEHLKADHSILAIENAKHDYSYGLGWNHLRKVTYSPEVRARANKAMEGIP